MSITDYVRLLRNRGWILIIAAILTAVSAFIFSKIQTTIWKSSVVVGIQPTRPDFGLTQSAKDLLRYYATVINTRTYAQKVVDSKQLDMVPDELLGNVTIAADGSRFVIQIDFKNGSAEVANGVTEAWANALVDWRNAENAKIRLEDQVKAVILEPPQLSIDSPKTTVNTLAGGILGLLLGGVIIFLLEYLESNVLRSPQDIERALSLSVLGAIPVFETSRRK